MIVNLNEYSLKKAAFVVAFILIMFFCAALCFNRSREVPQTDAAITSVRVEVERLDRTVQRIDKTVKGEVSSNEQKVQGIDVSAAIDELVRAFRKSCDDL